MSWLSKLSELTHNKIDRASDSPDHSTLWLMVPVSNALLDSATPEATAAAVARTVSDRAYEITLKEARKRQGS